MKTIGILGEGAWGTALANLCADNGHTVYLWCHDKAVQETIATARENTRYLPGILVHPLVVPTCDLRTVFSECTWIIETTPVQYLRSVLEKCDAYATAEHNWVIASKGIEQNTLFFPSDILHDVLRYPGKQVVMAGPSFARELANRAVTAVDIASAQPEESNALKALLENSYFKIFVSRDVQGLQIAAALKNVIALGVGMLHGAGYADNTKIFFFMHCMRDLSNLSLELGGHGKSTTYGLAGMGDCVLTCFGAQSRNREIGYRLGQGASLDSVLAETGYIPEGLNSVKSLHQLIQRNKYNLPVFEAVHDVVFGDKPVQSLVDALRG